MKVEQIRYALEIYREGSVNKAARTLFVSQPALSYALKSLETELGKPIFQRTYAGMALTEFGKVFMENAEELVKSADRIEEAARSRYLGEPPLSFRVSVYYLLFAWQAFLALTQKYQSQAANFHYNQVCLSHVLQDVDRRETELGLISIPTIDKEKWLAMFRLNDLEYESVYEGQPMAMLGAANPLYHRELDRISCQQLWEQPFVVIGEPQDLFNAINRKMADCFRTRNIIEVNDRTTAHDYLREQGGFCCVNYISTAYTEHDFFPGIKAVPIEGLPFQFEIGWLTKRGHELSALAKEYKRSIQPFFFDNQGDSLLL